MTYNSGNRKPLKCLFMKKILATSLLTLITLLGFSQNYGSIEYMGKKFYITADFFKSLNEEYNNSQYIKSQKIYYDLVDFLKKKESVIYVDEAKRITWTRESDSDYPYSTIDKVSKRNRNYSSTLLYGILLPVIEKYAR